MAETWKGRAVGGWSGDLMSRHTVLLALVAPIIVTNISASSSAKTLQIQQELDSLVPDLLEEHRVPGAAIAVVEKDQNLVRGYGLRRADLPEPIGPDTVFEAASLGKPVFAYAMLKREAEGLLDLDRPLSASLQTPFVDGDPRIDRITARHVLAHTTGFPNWRPKRFSENPGPLQFLRDPGSQFGYSGEGYSYLQVVIEEQTGVGLEAIMQAQVFGPLGMTRSGFRWSAHFEPDFAWPHNHWGEAGYKWYPEKAGVAYSLHSTARDFARFLETMLADDDRIAAAMLAPQVTLPGTAQLAWSLGWGIEHRPDGDWFWQWGDNDRFKHFAMGSRRQQRAILVLTNGRNGAKVHRAIIEAVLGFQPRSLSFEMIRY